jgi:hypothetical protein
MKMISDASSIVQKEIKLNSEIPSMTSLEWHNIDVVCVKGLHIFTHVVSSFVDNSNAGCGGGKKCPEIEKVDANALMTLNQDFGRRDDFG